MAGVPFIIKGVMNVKTAEKAIAAQADAIVVSNHGGRVLDQCPATAEVLEEIAEAVKTQMNLSVDKKKIQIKEGIKTLGTHMVSVKLHPEVTAELKVIVKEEA